MYKIDTQIRSIMDSPNKSCSLFTDVKQKYKKKLDKNLISSNTNYTTKAILSIFIVCGSGMCAYGANSILTNGTIINDCLYDVSLDPVTGQTIKSEKEIETCFDAAQFEVAMGIMIFAIGIVGLKVIYDDEQVIKKQNHKCLWNTIFTDGCQQNEMGPFLPPFILQIAAPSSVMNVTKVPLSGISEKAEGSCVKRHTATSIKTKSFRPSVATIRRHTVHESPSKNRSSKSAFSRSSQIN